MKEVTVWQRRQGWLMVAAAATLWGTLGPTFKGLSALGATPVTIGFWRAFLASAVLFMWLSLRRPLLLRLAPRDLPFFVAYGFISVALYFVLYSYAVELSTVATAAVLLYTAPAWVALLAALFLGEPLTMRKGAAIATAFVGTALVAGVGDGLSLKGNGWGIAAGLGSGVTYATLGIFGKAALRRYDPSTTMLYALGLGVLLLAPWVVTDWEQLVAPLYSFQGWILLLYLGVAPTTGGLLLYTRGLAHLNDAGRASLIATIEPLVAALLGLLLFREVLGPVQWLGGGLILLGVLLLKDV